MTDREQIAATWWEQSGSPSGERYAAMIRAKGEGYALARGQLDAIIAKGARKGELAGLAAVGPAAPEKANTKKAGKARRSPPQVLKTP